jgi:hypothetical protein
MMPPLAFFLIHALLTLCSALVLADCLFFSFFVFLTFSATAHEPIFRTRHCDCGVAFAFFEFSFPSLRDPRTAVDHDDHDRDRRDDETRDSVKIAHAIASQSLKTSTSEH